MTKRRSFFLFSAFLCAGILSASCSGSGINNGIGSEGANADDVEEARDDAMLGDAVANTEDGADMPAYPALDCLAETCEGQECRNSATCVVGLVCMAACTDMACASTCLESVDSEDDKATLEALMQCALAEGCLSGESDGGDCGNLVCEAGESADSCPADCTGDAMACLTESCQLGNCLDIPACSTVVDCMAKCANDACADACVASVPEEGQAFMQDIADCGKAAECFTPVGPGPGVPGCGDGTCEADEGCDTCSEDCGACPGTSGCCEAQGGLGCEDSACAETVCALRPECCDESWTSACATAAQELCEVCQSGPVETCGDGTCSAEENTESCPEDCPKEEPKSCISEACDLGQCLNFAFCADIIACIDACETIACAEGCTEDAPGSVAGLLSDALACGSEAGCFEGGPEPEPEPEPEPDKCLGDSCDSGNCADFPECASALECMSACDTVACAEACVAATPSIFQPPLNNLVECGIQEGCFEASSTSCGDGACNGDEDTASCPEDCSGPEKCGDGTCDEGENCANCSDDCQACTGPCCSPHEGPGCSDGGCQASVCAADESCCSGDWSWECAQLAADLCPSCSSDVVCGDDECAPSENPTNCPEDCNANENDFLSCMFGVCEDELLTCFDDDACADAFPCLEDCVNNGGTGCTSTCMPNPESDVFYQVGLCGGQNGCGNICGDGSCGPGETNQSCPEDCDAPVEPPEPEGCSSIGEASNGGEFILCIDEANWTDSQERCEDMGGDLASIASEADNKTIADGVVNATWIGMNDFDVEGDFAWINGTAVTYTNWNGGEPNDYNNNEDCTEMIVFVGSEGAWNDAFCEGEKDFVCLVGGDNSPPPNPGGGDGCVSDNCDIGWQCQWGGCEEAIACVEACDSPECADACAESASWWQQDAISAYATCAEAAGCF